MLRILGWKPFQLLLGFLSQAVQFRQHNSLIFFDPMRMGRAAELGRCQCSAVKHMEGLCGVFAMLLLFAPSCAICVSGSRYAMVSLVGSLLAQQQYGFQIEDCWLVVIIHCFVQPESQCNLYATLQVWNPQHYDPSHQASWVQLPVKLYQNHVRNCMHSSP